MDWEWSSLRSSFVLKKVPRCAHVTLLLPQTPYDMAFVHPYFSITVANSDHLLSLVP